jgi:hypothetical protein
MTWIAAANGILVFAVVAWVWVHIAQSAAREIVDLRLVSPVTAQNPTEDERQTLVLYRWARQLIVDLPAGSKPGTEEIAIFSETGSEIFDTTATARLQHQVVCVEVDIEVSRFQPGQYFLGVRQPGLTWNEYPVRVTG